MPKVKVNKEIAKEILKQAKSNKASKNDLRQLDSVMRYYDMTDEHITSQMVIHKVMETLEVYLKTIQQILQPEEFHALYEAGAFDEKEKADLFNAYKRIIIMHRELLKALIINDEKHSILTIKEMHDQSLQLKPKMILMVEKLQKSWSSDVKPPRNALHYVG